MRVGLSVDTPVMAVKGCHSPASPGQTHAVDSGGVTVISVLARLHSLTEMVELLSQLGAVSLHCFAHDGSVSPLTEVDMA